MVLDLLRAEKIMIVHGTGFNWPEPDHFRIVTLPPVRDLEDAVTRIGAFLDGYSQPLTGRAVRAWRPTVQSAHDSLPEYRSTLDGI